MLLVSKLYLIGYQGFFGSHDFEMLGCPALDGVSVRVDRLIQGKEGHTKRAAITYVSL